MSPYEVLRAAAADLGERDAPPHARLALNPPADARTVAKMERNLKAPLPVEIRELLAHTSGFTLPPDECDFTSSGWPGGASPYDLLQACVQLEPGADVAFVDVDPETGAWEGVWQIAHDEPSLWMMAPDLTTWLRNVLEPHREMGRRFDLASMDFDEYRETLVDVGLELAAAGGWDGKAEARVQPRLAGDLIGGEDLLMAEFCAGLDPAALVYDLRAGVGASCEFPHEKLGNGRFHRCGRSYVWALQNTWWQPPREPGLRGLARRLLGRS